MKRNARTSRCPHALVTFALRTFAEVSTKPAKLLHDSMLPYRNVAHAPSAKRSLKSHVWVQCTRGLGHIVKKRTNFAVVEERMMPIAIAHGGKHIDHALNTRLR